VLKIDDESKVARLSLCSEELLPQLQEMENKGCSNLPSLWRPECGAYMIEGTPGVPYGGQIDDLTQVEENMRAR